MICIFYKVLVFYIIDSMFIFSMYIQYILFIDVTWLIIIKITLTKANQESIVIKKG